MITTVYAVTLTVTTPALTGEQITPGKLYRVLYESENSFDIIDDNGKGVPCFWQGCVFGDAWTRCELVADEPAQAANPPAFPRDHRHLGHNGMDMRDWFAGQALAGGMAAADNWNFSTPEQCGRQAYQIADAMLAERAKGGAA